MSTDYVYFFKHNGIKGIKIGKTSGESVLSRFNSFKTYSPSGAEIIGFFKTNNGYKSEKDLHKRFASHRLNGEFFDISDEIVETIISENNDEYLKAKKLFNEWIADENNNIEKLVILLKSANKETIKSYETSFEKTLLDKYVTSGMNRKNTTEIYNFLKATTKEKISLNILGSECRKLFKRIQNNGKGYCYLVDFNLTTQP